jgi:hypothetical protein
MFTLLKYVNFIFETNMCLQREGPEKNIFFFFQKRFFQKVWLYFWDQKKTFTKIDTKIEQVMKNNFLTLVKFF